jgi:hypothetical protein
LASCDPQEVSVDDLLKQLELTCGVEGKGKREELRKKLTSLETNKLSA